MNPFGDSVPFPESNPLNAGYEKIEEVSLEQLLEGRERPATMSGTIPVPLEEVEELGAEEMVPIDESPLSVALMDEPAPARKAASAASNGQVAALEKRVKELEGSLKEVLKALNDLTARVRNQIGQ